MQGLEKKIISCEIDPLLIVAIGLEESKLGSAYSEAFNNNHHNPFGLMSEGLLIPYDSWDESINAECELLTKLLGKGAANMDMLGAVYASSSSWPIKIASFYNQLWSELENL